MLEELQSDSSGACFTENGAEATRDNRNFGSLLNTRRITWLVWRLRSRRNGEVPPGRPAREQ